MTTTDHRVLIVDDNPAIHADFAKILAPSRGGDALDELESMLLDTPAASAAASSFELAYAHQGQAALALVTEAVAQGRPFAVAFVDMRMPPGWDGVQTIEQLWKVDPALQIVICSAYSDYSWDDLQRRLGPSDSLLIVKKPFDTIEVVQATHALATKWTVARQLREQMGALEANVVARTAELREANAALARELAERARMEAEVRLSQKLEAVGQLAAGIAHEINTPTQYVGDNLTFLRESTVELLGVATALVAAAREARDPATAALVDRLVAIADAADLGYLAEQIPQSLDSIDGGIERITKIVRAMKELAHPGPREATSVDITHSLHNALAVTAATYRHIAELQTDFAPIPAVLGYGGELNQVFLNLIVNAAHAMEERGGRGVLRVATRQDGSDVVISIADTGTGIPEGNRDRVFDAFFTTKEVGRGTGQGLAISRSIVVDHHAGSLTFDSTVGVGTTFHIRLPIRGPHAGARSAA